MKYSEDEIKELILTDYLDDELDLEQRKAVEAYVAQHPELQEFVKTAKGSLKEPFENIKQEQPPEQVWHHIKESIEDSRISAPSPFKTFIKRLKESLSKPSPALAFGSLSIILLLGVGPYVWQKASPTNNYSDEQQIEYLSLLVDDDLDSSEEEDGFIGSAIEDYFL